MTAEAVSVLIPVYNGERFIAQAIESLLDQSHSNFRLTCIDDCSTDRSVEIMRRFDDGRLSIRTNPSRIGLARNWNRALDMATETPYLVIAHQDDIYEREYLEQMIDLMESHPRAFMGHCRTLSIDESGSSVTLPAAIYKETFWPRTHVSERPIDEEIRWLQKGNYIVCPTVMFRRSALSSIGRFNEQLEFVTDWEYWLRGLFAGFTIAGLRSPLVRFRRHPWTATRALEKTFRRYEEELILLDWLDCTAAALGTQLKKRSNQAVNNNLLTEFAGRLASGDRQEAVELLLFAKSRVKGFRHTLHFVLMNLSLPFGRSGGAILRSLEKNYLKLALRFRRAPA
jgi:glycosyltransferase involved in cell wall biosynthesis